MNAREPYRNIEPHASEPPEAPLRAAIRRDNLRALLARDNYFRPAGETESERRFFNLHRLPKDAP